MLYILPKLRIEEYRKEVSRLEGKLARHPDFEDSTYLHSDTGQIVEDYRMKEWMTCCLQVKTTGSRPNPWGTTNLAFEEWAEIFGSEQLTGATSWKPMEKVTDCDKPGNDLTGNPHHGRTQTHKKRTNDLTGNLKPIYL